MGSISLWDARPACIPQGSLRGEKLLMEREGGGGAVALHRIRFKVTFESGRAGVMEYFLFGVSLYLLGHDKCGVLLPRKQCAKALRERSL